VADDNGWSEYRQRVFYQLDTLTKQVETMQQEYHQLQIDVIVLKAKAAIYGALASGVIAVGLQIFFHFIEVKTK
jgi:hypothetical protein